MSRNARVLGALLTPVVTVPVAAQAAHAYDPPAPPKNPNLPRELDVASPYIPQSICDPTAKPGVTAFAKLVVVLGVDAVALVLGQRQHLVRATQIRGTHRHERFPAQRQQDCVGGLQGKVQGVVDHGLQ